MKGIIFTEFLDMVERDFGIETLDAILSKAKLSGVYTSVGTYPDSEMNNLVQALSGVLNKDVNVLHEYFGKSLFHGLLKNYPSFFSDNISLFEFINSIHDHIHVEVKKLYPDAVLPDIIVQNQSDSQITILYSSSRKYGNIAKGLLLSTIEYFNVKASLKEKKLSESGDEVLFNITLE